jgi:hypothetical protein
VRILLFESMVALVFAAGIGSLALAQDASTEQTQPPPDAAPPSDQGAENPAAKPADTQATDDCKGLAEKPCRKNTNCYWIIPKSPDASGQVPPAYCRKRGAAKAKPTTPPAAPSP